MTNAVSDISSHHTEAMIFHDFLNGTAHISDSITGAKLCDACEKALTGNFNQFPCLLIHLSNRNGSSGISMVAFIKGSNIHLDDIAFLNHRLVRRDTMNDLVIDGNARASGETAISEEGRLCTALPDVTADYVVKLLGRHAGMKGIAGSKQSFARDATGILHSSNLK